MIHPWLHGALSHGLALAISLTVAYVLTTGLHITIGEQVPKLVHANKLLELVLTEGPRASIAGVVRDALIVPETKPLDTLLAELRRTRNTSAVVVDEYGRTAGIVAVEDIVEEIVGEIADETDPSAGPMRRLGDGDWLVRGDVSLPDLKDYGIDLGGGTDSYISVGGLVLDAFGRLPGPGERLTVNGFSLTIESVRENRIELIRVARPHAD